MRKALLSVAAALGLMAVLPLRAECTGQNLIETLPEADRAALRAAADAVPFASGNLWRAEKNGQSITLVGTYHLDDPRHAATIQALAPALAAASTLLVEAGPKEEAELAAHMGKHPELLVNQSGPTLPEALPEADWQRLSDALRDRAIPPFIAAKMQPWYVMVLLSIPGCQMTQVGAANGLDRQLIDRAQDLGLDVAGLEPFDTVFTIFDKLGMADQVSILMQGVDAADAGDDMAVTLADSYFAGENRLYWEFSKLDAQRRSGLAPEQAERDFALLDTAMVTDRNKAWIAPILAASEQGPVVVAVGALHLPGEQGVLNLLAQQGWAVAPFAP